MRRRSASRPTSWCVGRLGGVGVVFLPRHGRGHRILPTEINFRANVYALKQLGVEWLLSRRRGRQPARGDRARARRRARSVHRPHAWRGRARSSATASSRTSASPIRSARSLSRLVVDAARARRRSTVHARRHLRLHGGAAVLDARRVAPLSAVGRRRHRHDQPAGGQARARGGDLLRQRWRSSPTTTAGTPARATSRSARCCASSPRTSSWRARDRRRGGAAGCRRARAAPARTRSRTRSSPTARAFPPRLRPRAGADRSGSTCEEDA